MRELNRAIDGAAAFRDMLDKIERKAQHVEPARQVDPEVRAWNEAVERKRAERASRRMEKAKP